MATKKAGGSSRNGRTSNPKYLGIKIYDNSFAKAGAILVRQRGRKFYNGPHVGIGKDDTLFAQVDGIVDFYEGHRGYRNRKNKNRLSKFVKIIPTSHQ